MLAEHRDGLSSSSFCLILVSSAGLSAGIQSAGDLVSETLMGSNPAFNRGRQLVSFRFEYRLPVPEHRNYIYIYIYRLDTPYMRHSLHACMFVHTQTLSISMC